MFVAEDALETATLQSLAMLRCEGHRACLLVSCLTADELVVKVCLESWLRADEFFLEGLAAGYTWTSSRWHV
jgi:hypothetical protein